MLGVSGFEKVTFAYPKSEYNARIFNTYDDIPEKLDDVLVNKLKTMARKVIKALPQDKNGPHFYFVLILDVAS